MLQYTELLWEMTARRRGQKTRWRVVVFLEFAKAICRLLLLRLTNSRPLVSPPLPEREVDPRSTQGEEDQSDWNGMETPTSERSTDISWTMPRTGLSLPSLPDVNDVSNYLISKVLTADDIKPPKTLLHRVTGQGQLAEVLYILRPVVYALAMQRWSGDRRSWRPWLIGFGMEYGCRQLAKRDFRERVAGGLRGLTGLEREELRKRGWSMGWWLLRGAFYENITKCVFTSKKIPLIGHKTNEIQILVAQHDRQDEGQASPGLGGQRCRGLRIPLGQLLLLDCYPVISLSLHLLLMIPSFLLHHCMI